MARTKLSRTPRQRRLAIAAGALSAVAAIAAVVAPGARGGTYRATQCNSALGAGTGDLAFRRTSSHYESHVACHGEGLTVRHVAGNKPTRAGRFGAWSLRAPSGARMISAAVRIAGEGRSGHRPQLTVGLSENKQERLGPIAAAVHTLTWGSSAGAASLAARLQCVRDGHCGEGRGAFVALHRISVVIRDTIGPALGLGGPIYASGSRRGQQSLEAIASDAGGGVRSVEVEVNGRAVGSKPNACAISGNVALRIRPCPEHVISSFALQTGSAPFHQGINEVRVCASDFSRDSAANRRCSKHEVRIDNLCPISSLPGAQLRAGFAHGRVRRTVRSDSRALVRGRLLDAFGRPVVGAEVCIASTIRGRRTSSERLVARPRTDPQGRFRLRLPRGPSRVIRVAHWPDAQAALERRLVLGSKAAPKLRLRPRHTIRNGNRVRFKVRLPSPSAAHRRVEVQARSGGRWIRVARGRTGVDGRWHGAYRFRATTGVRRYAFRAVAPHSKGYPFQPGHSKIRRARVTGSG